MEVLEVGDDSDMWVPHVSGVGRVRVGVKGGARRGFLAKARAWQCMWHALSFYISGKDIFECGLK
jgi:hypothetical protein